MAKRLTATEKWDKAWFRKLTPKHKCFWEYLRDKCDLIGLWETDFEAASFHIGAPIVEKDIFDVFKGKIMKVENKILILGFCHFQYGKTLSEKSTIHIKIKKTLIEYTLLDTLYPTLFNRVEREVEVKEEVKDKVKVKEKEKPRELIFPFDSAEFHNQWLQWKAYKRNEFSFKYKSAQSEQAGLTALGKLSEQNEQKAIAIIHRSMENGWKGFFKLETNGNRNNGNSKSDGELKKIASDTIDRMFGSQ